MKRITLVCYLLSVALVPGNLLMLSAQTDSMSNMGSTGKEQPGHSMRLHHMDMASHMRMTPLRPLEAGDKERAHQVLIAARKVAEKYQDYKVALADGFHIFMPNVPHTQYHFNNSEYAREAAEHFNPDHPTSLLYEKEGDGYRLIGVMYTAPKWTSEDELNQRIPLSIAQWHAHVNVCLPPSNHERAHPDPRFGGEGSISTQTDCEAAGGTFIPQIFGWMVHVYPFEKKAEEIWSSQRQMRAED